MVIFFSFKVSLTVKKKVWYIKMRVALWLLYISSHKEDLGISGGTVLFVTSSLLSWLLLQFCFILLPHLPPKTSTIMFKERHQT